MGLEGGFACVQVKDEAQCAVSGKIAYGGLCTHLRSDKKFTISTSELIDLIDAQPADRVCVPKEDLPVCADDQTTGVPATLPARGASIIMASAAWNEMKTELEVACRMLGKRCTYEMVQIILKHNPDFVLESTDPDMTGKRVDVAVE